IKMFSNRSRTSLVIFLSILCFFLHSEGRPLRKRSLGEVQLMHNLGEHKYVQQRQEWLQMKLKSIHTALMRNAEEGESRQYTICISFYLFQL
uniref:Parathyroid hormone n=1 Tax=Scleropages formosus TaxID=113540 RepID=A0A8C9RLN5_SCLFO